MKTSWTPPSWQPALGMEFWNRASALSQFKMEQRRGRQRKCAFLQAIASKSTMRPLWKQHGWDPRNPWDPFRDCELPDISNLQHLTHISWVRMLMPLFVLKRMQVTWGQGLLDEWPIIDGKVSHKDQWNYSFYRKYHLLFMPFHVRAVYNRTVVLKNGSQVLTGTAGIQKNNAKCKLCKMQLIL